MVNSNTDVLVKVNFVVAASHHVVLRWRKDHHSTWTEMVLLWNLVTFHGGILSCGLSQKRNCRI